MTAPATRQNAELLEGQNRVLELIAQDAPLPRILDLLLGVIQSQCPEMLCSILLMDPDGIHVRHGAARGLPPEFMRDVDGEPIGPQAGSCGTAAYRREAVIVEDIATDPLWDPYRELALKYGLRSGWSTPILDAEKKVLGTFAMYFREPGRPEAAHLRLIDVSTHVAAIAITRHQKREALRASEELLRLALSAGNVEIWEYDVARASISWHGSILSPLPVPSAQGLPLDSFLAALPPEDQPLVRAALADSSAWAAGHRFEFRIPAPDGSLRWFAVQGRSEGPAENASARLRGVAVEITERKRAEEEIARREAQLVEAQAIARVGSYEWDMRSNTVRRSPELYKIFGLRPSEFDPTYEGYLSRVHPDDRSSTKAAIDSSFRESRPFDLEERIVLPDGTIRTLHSQGRWSFDAQGRPRKLLGICQDITERKQAEQQLRATNSALAAELEERTRAEREIQALTARLITAQEEERTRLARELHDDLSQQIATLSIASSNLKKEVSLENDAARAQAERMRQKLSQLAEGVRRLSHHLHPAVLEYSGLGVALKNYCSEFAALTGMNILYHSEGSFEHLPAPVALSLYRIAQEALQNVFKHAKVTQAKLQLVSSAEFVRLTVSDEGVGLDLHPRGAPALQGLGLVSIKERTRLVNGTLRVESKPGQGTTVEVAIPQPPPLDTKV